MEVYWTPVYSSCWVVAETPLPAAHEAVAGALVVGSAQPRRLGTVELGARYLFPANGLTAVAREAICRAARAIDA